MTATRITLLLQQMSSGRDEALSELIEQVHAELKRMAHHALRREHGRALQTTELVNEVYLRLAGDQPLDFESRAHFFHAAATAMRRILVDAARRRNAAKRGGGSPTLHADLAELDRIAPGLPEMVGEQWADLVALHDALERLQREPALAAKGRVVELRFFAGLTIEQTADVLGISPATIKRDWEFCRSWLEREMSRARPRE